MIKSHVISSIVVACLFLLQSAGAQQTGIASYYADFFDGRKMANGDRYDPSEMTCAHPTAPIGTLLKVVRKDDPTKSVIVTVSDRGPYVKGRIIDLSKAAAAELDLLHHGITEVTVGIIRKPEALSEGYFRMSHAQD